VEPGGKHFPAATITEPLLVLEPSLQPESAPREAATRTIESFHKWLATERKGARSTGPMDKLDGPAKREFLRR
jgi:hypothetical protein